MNNSDCVSKEMRERGKWITEKGKSNNNKAED
jgi:hypothetical protein